MTSVAQRIASVVFGVGLGILVVAPFAAGDYTSDRARRCGGEGNRIQAEFRLEHAHDFWQRFPAAGRAPELEIDDNPAEVVVFQGRYDMSKVSAHGIGPQPDHLSRVVCVIQSDGRVLLYADISRTGSGFED